MARLLLLILGVLTSGQEAFCQVTLELRKNNNAIELVLLNNNPIKEIRINTRLAFAPATFAFSDVNTFVTDGAGNGIQMKGNMTIHQSADEYCFNLQPGKFFGRLVDVDILKFIYGLEAGRYNLYVTYKNKCQDSNIDGEHITSNSIEFVVNQAVNQQFR